MAVALPVGLAEDVTTTAGRTPGLLTLAIIQLSAWMFCRLLIEAQPRYMAFCFWVFVYIWFGIAAFLQVDHMEFTRREVYVGSTYSEHMLSTAAAIVLVGCVAYLVGTAIARSRPVRAREPGGRRLVLSLPRLQVASIVATLLAIVTIAEIGISNLFSSREAVASRAPAWTTSTRIVVFVAGFLVVYAFRSGRVFRWRGVSHSTRATMVTAVAGALIVANPIGTPRAISATVYGALLLAAIPRTSRRGIRLAFVGLLLSTVIVFPALDAFRREQPVIPSAAATEQEDTRLAEVLRNPQGNFAMFTQVADGVDFVDRFGTTNGAHLTADALVFIPRSIWKEKAYDVGDSVADELGYPPRLNFSSPMWMEFYVDGGWTIVVIGFLGYGWASQQLDRRSERESEKGFLPTLVLAVAFYQFYLLRGSLLSAMPLLYVLLLTMLVVFRRAPTTTEAGDTADPLPSADPGPLLDQDV